MDATKDFAKEIFHINDDETFHRIALDFFLIQAQQNLVYKKYIEVLNINPKNINSVVEIPFLPIEFFKTNKVILKNKTTQIEFRSSGTTSTKKSKHFIADLSLYEQSFLNGFQYFFGDVKDYCVLALLPSYSDQRDSSLIYMVEKLVQLSKNKLSGFFSNDQKELIKTIHSPNLAKKKILLIGVSFALLELAENHKIQHPYLMVMETGGMKGKRKEIVREELHAFLCKRLGVTKIYSEYGMTELLSQAYSIGNGIFKCPPWMKVLIRDVNDPFSLFPDEKSGGINIIDLANINSCSFIMTQDLGKIYSDGSFEVLGRFDSSDVRGCNLLIQ
jgi:hypothetical protein